MFYYCIKSHVSLVINQHKPIYQSSVYQGIKVMMIHQLISLRIHILRPSQNFDDSNSNMNQSVNNLVTSGRRKSLL